MNELILVGFTNGHQINYASEPEGEGCFYSNTDNECYIPLYMLETHHHRIESTSNGEVTTSGNHDNLVEENKRLREALEDLVETSDTNERQLSQELLEFHRESTALVNAKQLISELSELDKQL